MGVGWGGGFAMKVCSLETTLTICILVVVGVVVFVFVCFCVVVFGGSYFFLHLFFVLFFSSPPPPPLLLNACLQRGGRKRDMGYNERSRVSTAEKDNIKTYISTCCHE